MQVLSFSVSRIHDVSESSRNKALEFGFYILSSVGLEKLMEALPLPLPLKPSSNLSHASLPENMSASKRALATPRQQDTVDPDMAKSLPIKTEILKEQKTSNKETRTTSYLTALERKHGFDERDVTQERTEFSLPDKMQQLLTNTLHLVPEAIQEIISKRLYDLAETLKGGPLDKREEKHVEKAVQAVFTEMKRKFGSGLKLEEIGFIDYDGSFRRYKPLTGMVVSYTEKPTSYSEFLSKEQMKRMQQTMHKAIPPKLFVATVKVPRQGQHSHEVIYPDLHRESSLYKDIYGLNLKSTLNRFNLNLSLNMLTLDFLKTQIQSINKNIIPKKFNGFSRRTTNEETAFYNNSPSERHDCSIESRYSMTTSFCDSLDKNCRKRAICDGIGLDLSEVETPCSAMSFPASPGFQSKILDQHFAQTRKRLNLVKDILNNEAKMNNLSSLGTFDMSSFCKFDERELEIEKQADENSLVFEDNGATIIVRPPLSRCFMVRTCLPVRRDLAISYFEMEISKSLLVKIGISPKVMHTGLPLGSTTNSLGLHLHDTAGYAYIADEMFLLDCNLDSKRATTTVGFLAVWGARFADAKGASAQNLHIFITVNGIVCGTVQNAAASCHNDRSAETLQEDRMKAANSYFGASIPYDDYSGSGVNNSAYASSYISSEYSHEHSACLDLIDLERGFMLQVADGDNVFPTVAFGNVKIGQIDKAYEPREVSVEGRFSYIDLRSTMLTTHVQGLSQFVANEAIHTLDGKQLC